MPTSNANAKLAREYLTADMQRNYTGQSPAAREALTDRMQTLQRRYTGGEGIQHHAIVGADKDFDRPLHPGEREHQTYMRERHHVSHSDVLEGRRHLRGNTATKGTASGRRRGAVRAGVAGGRGYARARRTIAASSGVQGARSISLEAIGVGIGLAVLYLILTPGGSKALQLLLGGVTNVTKLLIGPYDPLNPTSLQNVPKSEGVSTDWVAENAKGQPLREYPNKPSEQQLAREFPHQAVHAVHGYRPPKTAATALAQGEIG